MRYPVLPMAQVTKSIAGQFQNLKQYREYVITNNLQKQGFPLSVYSAYKDEYVDVDHFLGNKYGTYIAWKANDIKQRQIWRLSSMSLKPSQKTTPIISNLSVVQIYKQLLELNVSSNTLKSYLEDINPTMDEMRELMNALMEHSSRHNKVKV